MYVSVTYVDQGIANMGCIIHIALQATSKALQGTYFPFMLMLAVIMRHVAPSELLSLTSLITTAFVNNIQGVQTALMPANEMFGVTGAESLHRPLNKMEADDQLCAPGRGGASDGRDRVGDSQPSSPPGAHHASLLRRSKGPRALADAAVAAAAARSPGPLSITVLRATIPIGPSPPVGGPVWDSDVWL